jgi:hypothetical protein
MSRRIALPGADELFRSTGEPTRVDELEESPAQEAVTLPMVRAVPEAVPAFPGAGETDDGLEEAASAVRTAPRRRARSVADRRPSGRERHEEKITVYVSQEELMDLEHARLTLRGDHGLPVDRGRVVREALAVVLADLEAKGEASILVRRLRGR